MRAGKAGNLYVLLNATQPGFIKIGKTIHHPNHRAQALSRETGVAGDFTVEYGCVTSDVHRAEDYIKDYLTPFRTGKKKEHVRDVGLVLAKYLLNITAERYGLPLTDLELEYDIRTRGIYIVMDSKISVGDAVKHINNLCNPFGRHGGATNSWGEPSVYLMTSHFMQESIKLPFTSAYTSQFREKLIESTSIKGFHITAELGRSHSISNFSQHTFKGNLEGTLIKQTMRYQDQTGIYNLSQFAHVPIPGEPYLYERIDHNSSRWNWPG